MFLDIGGKIKSLAKISAWVGCIVGVVLTIVFAVEEMAVWVILLPLIYGIGSFASAWPLYGFGQLVEDVSALRQRSEQDTAKTSAPAKAFSDLPEL